MKQLERMFMTSSKDIIASDHTEVSRSLPKFELGDFWLPKGQFEEPK